MTTTRIAVMVALLAIAGAAGSALRPSRRCNVVDLSPNTAVPCVGEDSNLRLQQELDEEWAEVQRLAGVHGSLRRPRFCFLAGVILIDRPEGAARLLGTYSPRHNEALIALTHPELESFGPCAIKHEMLHALGKTDAQINLLLSPPCPVAEAH